MRTMPKPVSPDAKDLMTGYQKEKAKKYGMEYIEPTQPKWFVSYPFMIALMAVLQVMTVMFGHKMLLFFGFQVSAGWIFLMPILFYLFQIASEVYGWQYARQIIWCNLLTNTMLVLIMSIFSVIPVGDFDHYNIEYAYKVLLNYQTPASITMLFGMFISDFITSSLMCWSRFQWNGKFVMIRIIILHCLAESIILSGGFITGAMSGFSMAQIWQFSYDSFLARSIMMIILLPFARFIIWYIQHKIEGVVVFDYKATFNPFKFGINPADSVQFNADGWDKISVGKIDVKKMAQAYSDDFFEEQDRNMQAGLAEQHKKYGIDKDALYPHQKQSL
jgi:uncharacterized PurR-regulated membrane protein YhhQ (DUF165 family)